MDSIDNDRTQQRVAFVQDATAAASTDPAKYIKKVLLAGRQTVARALTPEEERHNNARFRQIFGGS